jgi:outer membrane lipoprotein LolB
MRILVLNARACNTNTPRSRSVQSLLLAFAAVLLLAGCAVTPTIETWQSPTATLISDWQFTGRVSLTQDEQGWHAGLLWQEQAERFQLQISGPLGQEAFRLSGDAEGVLLEDKKGNKTRAGDAESLLLQTTGWSLPVSGLRYWVRGLPVPGVKAGENRDLQGRLLTLEQSGWSISYSRYHFVAGVGWPAKMRLVRDDVSVRLVIDEWRPNMGTGLQM